MNNRIQFHQSYINSVGNQERDETPPIRQFYSNGSQTRYPDQNPSQQSQLKSNPEQIMQMTTRLTGKRKFQYNTRDVTPKRGLHHHGSGGNSAQSKNMYASAQHLIDMSRDRESQSKQISVNKTLTALKQDDDQEISYDMQKSLPINMHQSCPLINKHAQQFMEDKNNGQNMQQPIDQNDPMQQQMQSQPRNHSKFKSQIVRDSQKLHQNKHETKDQLYKVYLSELKNRTRNSMIYRQSLVSHNNNQEEKNKSSVSNLKRRSQVKFQSQEYQDDQHIQIFKQTNSHMIQQVKHDQPKTIQEKFNLHGSTILPQTFPLMNGQSILQNSINNLNDRMERDHRLSRQILQDICQESQSNIDLDNKDVLNSLTSIKQINSFQGLKSQNSRFSMSRQNESIQAPKIQYSSEQQPPIMQATNNNIFMKSQTREFELKYVTENQYEWSDSTFLDEEVNYNQQMAEGTNQIPQINTAVNTNVRKKENFSIPPSDQNRSHVYLKTENNVLMRPPNTSPSVSIFQMQETEMKLKLPEDQLEQEMEIVDQVEPDQQPIKDKQPQPSYKKSQTMAHQDEEELEREPYHVEWWEFMDRHRRAPKKWNISDYVNCNSDRFDPLHYMTRRSIECQKLHYSVPIFLNDISAMIKYESKENQLKIFNVTDILIKEQEKIDMEQEKSKMRRFKPWDKPEPKQQQTNRKKSNLYKLDQKDQVIDIDKIYGFVYGPFLSRFWMSRIGMNQLILDNSTKVQSQFTKTQTQKENDENDKGKIKDTQSSNHNNDIDYSTDSSGVESDDELLEIPFHAWQCISLVLKDGRDVDLVIKDEQNMKIFILFLIMKLKSFDGVKNTMQNIWKINKENRRKTEGQVMQRIYRRYLLMKVQMKISYEACRQSKTIQELFLSAILKTYKQRMKQGLIMNPYPHITKKQINGIQYLCLKNLTEASQLDQEARERQKQDLINKGKMNQVEVSQSSKLFEDEHAMKYMEIKGEINTNQNELLNILRAIQKQIYIDDQFKGSEEEERNKLKLVSDFLVQKKDKNGQVKYSSNSELSSKLNEKLERIKQTIMFKNKILKQEKETLYSKLTLLIKLRLLEGPLFVYALKELISIRKQLFVLELEKGSEVAIPKELNQLVLPLSYQFYDCILEIIRQNVNVESKYYFVKQRQHQKHKEYSRSKSYDESIQDKEIQLSNAEKFKRYVNKKLISKSCNNDEDYRYKLKLYQRSSESQAGPYAQIKRKELRLRYLGLNQEQPREYTRVNSVGGGNFNTTVVQTTQGRVRNYSLKEMSYGKIIDIHKFKHVEDNAIKSPNVQLICQYISGKKVGKKRKNLFAKKIFYQNQLSSLKQKGKRLIMCEKVDQELNQKKNQFLEFAENDNNALGSALITDQEKKESIQRLENVSDHFNEHTLKFQEQNTQKIRASLIKLLVKAKTFDARNELINNKIEYDQRFFNSSYSGFQLIISDIRKQIRINNELMRLKKKVSNVCGELKDKKTSTGRPARDRRSQFGLNRSRNDQQPFHEKSSAQQIENKIYNSNDSNTQKKNEKNRLILNKNINEGESRQNQSLQMLMSQSSNTDNKSIGSNQILQYLKKSTDIGILINKKSCDHPNHQNQLRGDYFQKLSSVVHNLQSLQDPKKDELDELAKKIFSRQHRIRNISERVHKWEVTKSKNNNTSQNKSQNNQNQE